jgi:hypothetical protein
MQSQSVKHCPNERFHSKKVPLSKELLLPLNIEAECEKPLLSFESFGRSPITTAVSSPHAKDDPR